MTTFVEHKKSALETTISAILSLLQIDKVIVHDKAIPTADRDASSPATASTHIQMQPAETRHQQCLQQLHTMCGGTESVKPAMADLAQRENAEATFALLRTCIQATIVGRSEEHTSELQSLMR